MPIIAIVPRLAPAIDGVGDYAFNLACQLRHAFNLDTHFIIGDPTWRGDRTLDGFSVTSLPARSASALLNQLAHLPSTDPILLHYVGYGYAQRGCPSWLVNALDAWKQKDRDTQIVTMFHEISAEGRPPWTSAFWLSPLQRHLAERLVQLSDRLLTSKQLYAEILQRMVTRQASDQSTHQWPIATLPIFSNVGEPETILPLEKRDRTLVVFGGLANRSRVYQHCQLGLLQAYQQLGIDRILDIGPARELDISVLNHLPIHQLGEQSTSEVSRLLSTSLAGFIDYPVDFLGKSSIFASYCAHGMVPIVGRPQGLDADGLIAQTHYWLPDLVQEEMTLTRAQAIAQNAHTWYQTHSLPQQAGIYAKYLVIDHSQAIAQDR